MSDTPKSSICVLCLSPVSLEEFLTHDHACIECYEKHDAIVFPNRKDSE